MPTTPQPFLQSLSYALLAGLVGAFALNCSGGGAGPSTGQSSFVSAPPGGASKGGSGLAFDGPTAGGASTGVGTSTGTGTGTNAQAGGASASSSRAVEETDLYRVENNRLYYLNSYRGLMVFDVTNIDSPKFLGRSPIFGNPIEMHVKNGVASVVVADWYGSAFDGEPFHGSVVRTIDATDPANMKVLGEAQLGGSVLDTRVVGDVIYAVSQEESWFYGWDYGYGIGVGVGAVSTSAASTVMVTAVNVGNGAPVQVGSYSDTGYGAVFNVTQNAILFAHFVPDDTTQPWGAGHSELQYVDISDPGGAIKVRGSFALKDLYLSNWYQGADNGRWNLDFADGSTAHLVGCASMGCSGAYDPTTGTQSSLGLSLATVDFSNPDTPVLVSSLAIPTSSAWGSPVARFTPGRMYLSSGNDYTSDTTTFQVYDLSKPASPALAGSTSVPGSAWLFMPADVNASGNVPSPRIFIVGQEVSQSPTKDNSSVSVRYVDVSDPTKPTLLGDASFGSGWAWSPVSDTFKAFVMSPDQSLIALPFAGWSYTGQKYNNGVELVEFTPTSIRAASAAFTKGWVERGIFVNNRVVSLSDQALAVIDATDHNNPKTVTEITLALNVVDVKPAPDGKTIAEVTSDWWGYDQNITQVRVVSAQDPEEIHDIDGLGSAHIDGYDAQVFHNGTYAYVVTYLDSPATCPADYGADATCSETTQLVTVVDASHGAPKVVGSVKLPSPGVNSYLGGYYWGYWDYYGWYAGADVVQVGGDALAFRRWLPNVYLSTGGTATLDEAHSALFVVDLHDPAKPTVASTTITDDPTNSWWGALQAIGNRLYAASYDWIEGASCGSGNTYCVRYYLNEIDLTDRSKPSVAAHLNVPGVLVGGSSTDPSVLYTVDYTWRDASNWMNTFNILRVEDKNVTVLGTANVKGEAGNVFVTGQKAWMSVNIWDPPVDGGQGTSTIQLAELDFSSPAKPTATFSQAKAGWGWLMSVQGDRAFVTSGWGGDGFDIYRLGGAAPTFDQSVRLNGSWASSISRQGSRVYVGTGYYGVQAFTLSN